MTTPGGDGATLPDSRPALVRSLRAGDDALYPDFLAHVSAEDRRFRFFSAAELSTRQIWDSTHFDPEQAIVLVAERRSDGSILGVARLHRLDASHGREGEFAVLVRSDLKGRGIGRALMEEICARAASIGVASLFGLILGENVGMLAFARDFGFALAPEEGDPGLIRAEARIGAAALAG